MNFRNMLFFCVFSPIIYEEASAQNTFLHSVLTKTEDTPSRAAAEVANNNFVLRHGTLILGEDTSSIATEDFLKAYKGNVILYEDAIVQMGGPKIDQFVIFVEVREDLETILQNVSELPLFNNTGLFIIVCTSVDCEAQYMFRVCWHHLITNVVVLSKSSTSIEVKTYYPYGPSTCGETEPVILFEWISSKNSLTDQDIKSLDLFPDKFLNLFGCPITVAISNFPPFIMMQIDDYGKYNLLGGFDVTLLKVIARHLNMSIEIVPPNDGTGPGYYNGTSWTGSLGVVFDGRANLTMTAVLSPERNENFHSSNIYRIIQLVWVSPPPSLAEPWTKAIRPFDMYTWLAFYITYSLAILSLYAMRRRVVFKRFRMVFGRKKLPDNLILSAWAIITGNPITRSPRRIWAIYFVGLWLLFSFLIRNSYQGALVGILRKNIYADSFQNIHDAIDAGYAYGGVAVSNVFPNDTYIFKHFRVIQEKEKLSTLRKMSDGSLKFVLATGIEQVLYFRDINNIVLDVFPDRIIYMPVVFFARRYSPLFRAIDRVIDIMVNAGISDQRGHRQIPMQVTDSRWQGEEALSFSNLACAFSLIGLGWLVSTITFTMEIGFYWTMKFRSMNIT